MPSGLGTGPLEGGGTLVVGSGRISLSPRSFQVVKTLHNKLYESRGKTR